MAFASHLIYNLSSTLELHPNATAQKGISTCVRPCALNVAQTACFLPAASLASCLNATISAPNQRLVRVRRPSRLGAAKSHRAINQRKDERTRTDAVSPPPHMVRRVHRVVSSDLSRSSSLPSLPSLVLTFGYKFLLCRGFRLPFPSRSRSHISRSLEIACRMPPVPPLLDARHKNGLFVVSF